MNYKNQHLYIFVIILSNICCIEKYFLVLGSLLFVLDSLIGIHHLAPAKGQWFLTKKVLTVLTENNFMSNMESKNQVEVIDLPAVEFLEIPKFKKYYLCVFRYSHSKNWCSGHICDTPEKATEYATGGSVEKRSSPLSFHTKYEC
jgi:hypothetical protein